MKYFIALILALSTFQYFSMAVISKGLTLLFLSLVPLGYILYRKFIVSSYLKTEIFLGLCLLLINIISLILNGGAIDSAIISIQFPLIFFLLSISSPLIFIKITYTFDDLVGKSTLILFLSWIVFTLFGLLVLGESLWWNDQDVSRLKGALGVAPSSILNSLIFISSFYLFVFRKKKIFAVIMILSFIFVYLSGTRVSLVSCLLAISIMLLFSDFRNKNIYISVLVPSLSYLIYSKVFTRLVHAGGSFNGIESINFNGRLFLWDLLWSDINNLYLGQGTGSSVELLKVNAVGVGVQPHNDYIRIFHDTGIFGLFIFIMLLIIIIIKLMKAKSTLSDKNKKPQYAFVSGLMVAFISMMFTDNLYIYVFFFFPMLLYYFHTISVNTTFKGATRCQP